MSDKPTEPQAEDTAPKIPTFTERLDDWQRRRAEQSEQIEQDGETLRQLNEAAHIAGQNSRLYMPTAIRMPFVYVCAFVCGGVIGSSQASKMAGLRFRAEHAHMLPTTTTGWYMYHKSKNYVVARSAVKGFWKMGRKVSLWTVGFLGIEDLYDRSRQTKDALNTTMAALTIGGVFSLMNRFSLPMTARTTKTALLIGLVYGGAQDVAGYARGRPIGYVEWIRKRLGSFGQSKDLTAP